MSTQNEHYLEKIRLLEEDNANLKQALLMSNNTLKMRDYQLRLATQERDYISDALGWQELQTVIGKWYSSEERADTMRCYVESLENCTQESCDEVISDGEYDCIDIANHERYKLSEED